MEGHIGFKWIKDFFLKKNNPAVLHDYYHFIMEDLHTDLEKSYL